MDFNIKDATAGELRFIWDHAGYIGGEKRVELMDALSVPNAPMLFPKVFSNIVKEAQEPLLVGASLLTRINYQYGMTISFPAVGAMVAADIAEGQEYPIRNINMGGATAVATVGKSGLALQITEEMVRFSQYDVIGMHLRAAGRALARHKEQKIFNFIRKMGTPVFDNLNPGGSHLGVLTGRDMQGNANGACTMDDVFDAYAQVLMNGYVVNTLLMHPLTWTMWVKDAQLRAFVQANGGAGSMFGPWSGSPNQQAPWASSSMGGLGIAPGQQLLPGETSNGGTAPHGQTPSSLLAYPQTMNSAPVLPSYAQGALSIVVSPYVWYDPRRKLTDIYMFDRNELGALVVDHDVVTDQFNDPRVDIMKIKLKERYAIAILNEGQAIATLRNVHCVPNEIVLPAQSTIDVSSSQLAKIDPSAALSL
jgi:hypothetical protein